MGRAQAGQANSTAVAKSHIKLTLRGDRMIDISLVGASLSIARQREFDVAPVRLDTILG
jgi:hypothetical protein